MWSKDGRFVEGLHAFGDILTKISANWLINLHVALLFTCLYLWVYLMCVYNCLNIMGISCICCMYMFTVISV
jgi:hypothetical protein